MGLITGPKKGESKKLNITEQAQQRIVIGLSWHKKELSASDKASQVIHGLNNILFGDISLIKANYDRLFQKMDTEKREDFDQNFDLDLACYAYDKKGNFKSLIDSDTWNMIDKTGKIYHSGDDMEGSQTLDENLISSTPDKFLSDFQKSDDEQIHIEFKNLSDDLDEFFIVIKSDCAHSFKDVIAPEVRVADSISNANDLHIELDKLENNDNYAFVFCRIFKKNEEWHIKNISEFCEFEQDWPKFLKEQFR